jgi:hypothetical protein
MIDPELAAKLDAIEAKVEAAYVAAEKARKYLFWTGVVSLALFILPLIGLVFAIPIFVSSYVNPLQSATGNPTSSSNSINDTLNTLNSLGI